MTIATSFISDIAGYIEARIAKIVLNETFTITSFEVKSIIGSTVSLRYKVPNGSVAAITRIELKDASNRIISSNDVNIPVTADALFLQTINIQEV
ncbi:ketopantoate hydroxymethyltransferase [Paenibacillus nasutitermitis]|uniref:Ketopantoate hydroxymethyltransferase n=1 Tax=Paenibacillus nasutitermitis TaxID=1652958 RepID=A0A916ZG10_9BACL|nr:ketopantoate hydroxymethyltransferase [Paenibacillus nasutitermitis]GGD95227.1 hypothetical protein GCM10010911_62400 [Paenibacillus nasutitermitis]